MSLSKDQLQHEAKTHWLCGDRLNTIVLGTGGGKTKVAIDIMKELQDELKEVLILVNSTALLQSWWDEIDKFWPETRTVGISVTTYQTAYKWEDNDPETTLIIYDECDFASSDEYGKVYTFSAPYKLGLTGFIPEDKQEFFQQYLPVCYVRTAQELQELGILNQSELIYIEYPLSNKKDIKVAKRAGGAFYQSENDYYKYYTDQVKKAQIVKGNLDRQLYVIRETGGNPGEQLLANVRTADFKVKMMIAKRKKILNSLSSSVQVVKNLVDNIHLVEGNKVVVFCGVTDQCDKYGYPTLHGKKTSTEKDLSRLNEGNINTLAVCKAIDRGVNMVGVNYIIKESFDGSEVSFHQTYGRSLRLRDDQVAKYIILLPTYKDKDGVKATQQSKWVDKMLTNFNAKVKTIRLGESLKLPEGIKL
jgi:superfamily II DNA or RNA helicase